MSIPKPIIYQLLPRLFGNKNTKPVVDGSRSENGTGKFNDIINTALQEIKKLGITHVWYTGIIEHAIVEAYPDAGIPHGNPLVIKGKAGSPYAIKDYYDVNPDLAEDVDERMLEFQNLVARTHQNDMKVIIDFVPNHLAREYHSDAKPEGISDFGDQDDGSKAFSATNNFYYLPHQQLHLSDEIRNRFPNTDYQEYPAKATGNDQFTAHPQLNDWYETVKLNYGVDYQNGHSAHFDPIPDTWLKMKDILLYWAKKEIDGFRCDMAEMVPVEFWQWVIGEIKSAFPDILFIAEVYNPYLYETYIKNGKFDYLYDKVGLYDTLKGVIRGERAARDISQCWQSLNNLDEYMLRFLENHDEQRIASPYFASDPIKALPGMMLSLCMHRGPVMIYSGQEFAETGMEISGYSGSDGRSTIFDYWNLPEHQKWMNDGRFDGELLSDRQKKLQTAYHDILKYAQLPAIVFGEFYDIMWQNTDSNIFNSDKVYAFLRHTVNQKLLVICNFDDHTQHLQVKIPTHALETMKIQRPLELCFVNKQSNAEHRLTCEEASEKGLSLNVSGYQYLLFEIRN
ncbi:alpha-amylase [Labilibaculum sp. A4]|uniref:alpha-amylase family glycosyl hydrolase n=1 Tax=Labilibaculum euxinus TaxID=2686357 RepID=UPI000F61FC35|nr:alpha-amylase family glycosyl hydrolase [Labilibaculum euxinus]MDQ1770158.1 alpha-amylase family glycosyl hydrolase [Labilibaculum euxinus]MWN77629.1 alpha-amylase [Labilibaculum euxinus]